jgi:hypothetical protein
MVFLAREEVVCGGAFSTPEQPAMLVAAQIAKTTANRGRMICEWDVRMRRGSDSCAAGDIPATHQDTARRLNEAEFTPGGVW